MTAIVFPARDYDLSTTLDSGQVFRWQRENNSWLGVVGKNWTRLTRTEDGIRAETAVPVENWDWLREFLQIETDLDAVLEAFPDDAPLRAAVAACRGLRVLRQDPWECLASFILSSTKQIVQIRQIISRLCERFGEPLAGPADGFGEGFHGSGSAHGVREPEAGRARHFVRAALDRRDSLAVGGAQRTALPTRRFMEGSRINSAPFSFPAPEKIAAASETELRDCKAGFRAPHLLAAARHIAGGKVSLEKIRTLPLAEARAELLKLRGVGNKIADCVLLFAYGFDAAFPVDVWVERALRTLYFPRRRVGAKRLKQFAATHFGPRAGYAQQYLFHYMRTKMKQHREARAFNRRA